MNRLKTKIFFVALTSFTLLNVISVNVQAQENPFRYEDHGKRDPLWPLVSSAGTIVTYDTDLLVSDLALEGITTGQNGDNVAIINGRVVKKDEVLGQFVVKEINATSVILIKGQEQFELKL